MPYHVVKRGTEYCVENKENGKTHGCHQTEDKARKQIFAINVSEGKIPGVKPKKG